MKGASFNKLYGVEPEIISCAPGRAEILGNHTDYNQGYALAAAIDQSTTAHMSKSDGEVHIYSSSFSKKDPYIFSINNLKRDEKEKWTNYAKAVVQQLLKAGYKIGGAKILVESDVPKSGGVSSSAAYELAVARALLALYNQDYDPVRIAHLCQIAENSDLVQSPCGFLDQGSSALAQKGKLVFFDFKPKGDLPISSYDLIPIDLSKFGATFVITVDPKLERMLGESGYVERRKMCEDSLGFWSEKLRRKIESLREVSAADFMKYKSELEGKNPVMRKRVEHVVLENQRVLDAVDFLKKDDIENFGRLLTESGHSALELYELDENTPQLTFLVEKSRNIQGVMGVRNMGGGFSAIALALVKSDEVKSFQENITNLYKSEFGNSLDFIEFSPAQGAEILKP